jgi:DMSO reductase anchor subunit
MNFTKTLLLGSISGLVSGLICMLYSAIYSDAFFVNFSSIVTPVGMFISSLIGGLLMSSGYFILLKWNKPQLIPIANILYCALSFASIVGILAFKLPLDQEFPEMFPGLTIPMHFFPALSFLALAPFFLKYSNK